MCKKRTLHIIDLLSQPIITVSAQRISTDILKEIRDGYSLPAIGLLDVSSDDELRRAVSGIRKSGNSTAVTPEDKFHLGSLTKAMTATLIAVLVESGTLAWNTTLEEALPYLADVMDPEHRGTTLEMLATHYSGIEKETARWFTRNSYDESLSAVANRQRFASQVLSDKPDFLPNTTWDYSNANYIILGHIIDQHATEVWEDFIQSVLWGPLNMTGCGFGTPPESSPNAIDNPWPHIASNPPRPFLPLRNDSDNPTFFGPAGTVHCDMYSYSRFLKMHLDALNGLDTTILPAHSFLRLHTPLFKGGTYTPGAWYTYTYRQYGGRYLTHDGTNTLNYAIAMLAPGAHRAIAAFTNVGDAIFALKEVREALFNGSLNLDEETSLSPSASVGFFATESTTASRTSSPSISLSSGTTDITTSSATTASPSSPGNLACSVSWTNTFAQIGFALLAIIYLS